MFSFTTLHRTGIGWIVQMGIWGEESSILCLKFQSIVTMLNISTQLGATKQGSLRSPRIGRLYVGLMENGRARDPDAGHAGREQTFRSPLRWLTGPKF